MQLEIAVAEDQLRSLSSFLSAHDTSQRSFCFGTVRAVVGLVALLLIVVIDYACTLVNFISGDASIFRAWSRTCAVAQSGR